MNRGLEIALSVTALSGVCFKGKIARDKSLLIPFLPIFLPETKKTVHRKCT